MQPVIVRYPREEFFDHIKVGDIIATDVSLDVRYRVLAKHPGKRTIDVYDIEDGWRSGCVDAGAFDFVLIYSVEME